MVATSGIQVQILTLPKDAGVQGQVNGAVIVQGCTMYDGSHYSRSSCVWSTFFDPCQIIHLSEPLLTSFMVSM